ncbi:MAG: hypothetical protein ABSB19_20420 [Methylomonas sp.]|jgi:hypothetical protein
MPPAPDRVEAALRRAHAALGVPDRDALGADEYNVFLKYLLLQGLDRSETRYWRTRWKQGDCPALRERLRVDLPALQACMEMRDGAVWAKTDADLYRERVIDLAVEAVLSEPLAPELCIKTAAMDQRSLCVALPGEWRHALIFASPYFFSHEFYPLAVDAYTHDVEKFGTSRISVIGAHIDWLTGDGRLKRVIHADFSSGRLIETVLDAPLQADSVQFLCLGRQEQAIHRQLSGRFTCLQVNPAPVSALADDKSATFNGWSALGVTVPPSLEIAPGDFAAAFAFLETNAAIVIKPNRATEGLDVAYFQRGHAQTASALKRHLEHCWQTGSVIAQQRRDSVFFRDPATGAAHTLALRLNLCADGYGKYYLESGYAQLGADIQHPAACGQGGRILAIHEVLPHLYTGNAEIYKPVTLGSEDWCNIRRQAELAAGLFNGLLLVGLDVLLDISDSGHIVPVVLEANPRPAGLSHSRLLTEDPFEAAEIGVSLRLWDTLNTTAQAAVKIK